ncbi:Alcohol acetyltransferase [Kalmusia sp. IMI 367209]|nr:Alcohol acetyltransferase [Kalmusia sp. IMI 367209]
MSTQIDCLRYTSPNEQRTVSREDLGFYHAVVVAATYDLPKTFDTGTGAYLYSALHTCIHEYNYLSVVVEDMHTDRAYYRRVPFINLEQHIFISEQRRDDDSKKYVEKILASEVDTPFTPGLPPWRIVVLPLRHEYLIIFSFSHTLGDGINGKAFHRTLLHALQSARGDNEDISSIFPVSSRPLPAPFDTPERLPISWSYLLAPFVALFIPPFLSRLMGLRTSASVVDAGTWTGSRIFVSEKPSHTQLKMREIAPAVLEKALRIARTHDAKFTGLFQHLVVRALNKNLANSSFTNFVSATAMNMRKSVGISDDQDGLFASGCYIKHLRHPLPSATGILTFDEWATITSSTRELAEASSTLQDQAIGLLRYLPSIRKWTAGKIGQQRDCSFEVSNIGTFEALGGSFNDSKVHARITQMVFATPGEIIGGPLKFMVMSVKGGTSVYTVSWKLGALNIGGTDEESFVEAVCTSIEDDLASLLS